MTAYVERLTRRLALAIARGDRIGARALRAQLAAVR